MIIDAHVHISTYTGKGESLRKCYKLLCSEMRHLDIQYAIIIPDNLENDPQIADLDNALKLTKNSNSFDLLGSPQIIQRGASEVARYRHLLLQGTIKGIKLFPGHDPYYPTDDRCVKYYELCQNIGAPIVFHTGENTGHPEVARFNDPKYIVEIARKYPKLHVVITHYFWPNIEYCYEITKQIPNIFFELAGTADKEVLKKIGGLQKMRKVLEMTVRDRPDKVIFGTDWPLCSIQDHIQLVQSLNISKEYKENIFWRNAVKLYKLVF